MGNDLTTYLQISSNTVFLLPNASRCHSGISCFDRQPMGQSRNIARDADNSSWWSATLQKNNKFKYSANFGKDEQTEWPTFSADTTIFAGDEPRFARAHFPTYSFSTNTSRNLTFLVIAACLQKFWNEKCIRTTVESMTKVRWTLVH